MLPAILAGAALAGLAAQMWGQHKQDEYNDDMMAFNKEQADKQWKEQRRSALRNMLGAGIATMPQKQDMAPSAPSMMGPMVGKGLADLIGQYAASRGANSQQFNPYAGGK